MQGTDYMVRLMVIMECEHRTEIASWKNMEVCFYNHPEQIVESGGVNTVKLSH